MKRIGITLHSLIVFIVLTISQWTLAISKEMEMMVQMETKANAVALRSSAKVMLEHYEIPLELLEADVAERTNKEFVNSLIVERNGKKYVRWIINPEDTKWWPKVGRFLVNHGIKPHKHTYFEGYMTASRSYIVVDPKTGAEFSFKGSTNRTGGNWRDKHQTWDDGKQIRIITDFVNDQMKKQPQLQNAILLDEPMAFGIKELDQGMIIRSYEELTESGKRYIPGFSIVHEKMGAKIAEINGSKDPAAYWNEHYNKPLARALTEFFLLTGMWYDSPHSQNFMVEVDAAYRPTGKIVLRDFGDTYLSTEFFKAIQREDIAKIWEQSNLQKDKMYTGVGILHGNKAPSWIDMETNNTSKRSYDQWGRDFFKEVQAEMARQAGLSLTPAYKTPTRVTTKSPDGSVVSKSKYISQTFLMNDASANNFLNLVRLGLQREHVMIRSCSRALLAM